MADDEVMYSQRGSLKLSEPGIYIILFASCDWSDDIEQQYTDVHVQGIHELPLKSYSFLLPEGNPKIHDNNIHGEISTVLFVIGDVFFALVGLCVLVAFLVISIFVWYWNGYGTIDKDTPQRTRYLQYVPKMHSTRTAATRRVHNITSGWDGEIGYSLPPPSYPNITADYS